MKTLKEKIKKQGGFTMVEMLIVVAIIAILMAVSIPMFNNALEKARHGVDAANRRSAISLANAEAIASLDPATEFKNSKIYFYIVDETGDKQGALVEADAGGAKPATISNDVLVRPKCTEQAEGDKKALRVKITYNPTARKDSPLDVFQITTNWTIDDNTGHVTSEDFK